MDVAQRPTLASTSEVHCRLLTDEMLVHIRNDTCTPLELLVGREEEENKTRDELVAALAKEQAADMAEEDRRPRRGRRSR